MRIPYVIDNDQHRLADVLNHLLQTQPRPQMDVATAYFSIRGYEQLRHTLPTLRRFRLLLGSEPQTGEDIGLRPAPNTYLRRELNREPLNPATMRLVEEIVRFLRRNDVEVRLFWGPDLRNNGRRRFLHAKCYLLYGGRGDPHTLFTYLNPLVGIVGSSNFTGPGLTTNRELNLVHKTLLAPEEIEDEEARSEVIHHAGMEIALRPPGESQRLLKSEVGARAILDLARWYDEQWQQAEDFKTQLIELLENSKFGGREYTPYEIYMKALYEYFKDDLGDDLDRSATRSAVELSEFQEDAVRKARRILARYDGVIVADSVGLGKTWIGKKLLEDYAYHQRQKALVICPAALQSMWQEELAAATIAACILSQERLGQEDFELRGLEDIDNRYEVMQLISAGPETPRFPPPYEEMDVFQIQERVIESILNDVTQQQVATAVSKPVAEEQTLASQILRDNLSNPAFDRAEIRELRKFLKQPLVGASVRVLREALKTYSASNRPQPLVETVKEIYSQQGEIEEEVPSRLGTQITRDDLHLVCYEYICA